MKNIIILIPIKLDFELLKCLILFLKYAYFTIFKESWNWFVTSYGTEIWFF